VAALKILFHPTQLGSVEELIHAPLTLTIEAPVAPWDPIPVAPVNPIEPVAPVAPVAPGGPPLGPCGPVAPTSPTELIVIVSATSSIIKVTFVPGIKSTSLVAAPSSN